MEKTQFCRQLQSKITKAAVKVSTGCCDALSWQMDQVGEAACTTQHIWSPGTNGGKPQKGRSQVALKSIFPKRVRRKKHQIFKLAG